MKAFITKIKSSKNFRNLQLHYFNLGYKWCSGHSSVISKSKIHNFLVILPELKQIVLSEGKEKTTKILLKWSDIETLEWEEININVKDYDIFKIKFKQMEFY